MSGPEEDTKERRREVLDAVVPLLSPLHRIVVVSPSSLGAPLPAFAAMRRAMLALHPGDLYERDDLVRQLVTHGYQRKEFVDEEGDISVRGGIVDVLPFARQQPVRLDFRDIEIESIRSFDLLTQRSIRPLEEVVITLSTLAGSDAGEEEEKFDFDPSSIMSRRIPSFSSMNPPLS